jgi:hypothetical protein
MAEDPNIKKTAEELAFLKDAINSIGETLKESLNSRLEESDSILQRIQNNIKKDTTKAILDLGKGFDGALKSQILLTQGALKQSDIQKQRNDLLNKEKLIQVALDQAKINGLVTDTEALNITNEINEQIKNQNKLLDKQEKELSRINSSLGVSGKLVQGISKIPVLGNLIDSAELLTKAQEKAAEKGSSKIKVLGEVGKQVGKSLVTNLTDPLVVFSAVAAGIVKSIKDVDKAAGDTARGMNMSYSEAVKFRGELKGAADASNSQYVTSKGLLETNLAINSALGTSVKLSDKNVQAFTELRVTAGLTNEELMGIQSLTITNGKSLEQNTGEIMAQAKFTGLKNGVLLNEKDILKGIKDVSSATTLTLGKNPKLIAEAVATAKSLGMEMSQIENISNSLLDFQSSIENELSAELLTGKQLNLETARYAALTGDVATVASEVAAQVGSAAEFSEMNRLQQEAIAKSVGMGREELAKTLYLQEQLSGLSGDEAKVQEDLLNKRIEEVGLAQAQKEMAEGGVEGLKQQADLATQFNSIVEKLQENFVGVATAIMPFFDAVAGIFGFLSKIPGLFPAILTGLAAMKAISAVVAAKEFAVATSKIFGTFAGIPFGLGIPLAIGAVAGLTGLISSFTADDLFSPGQGGAGYGKRTLLAPEGAYRLNDNDNIVATTNPINANDLISKPKGAINVAPQQVSQRSEIKVAPSNTQIAINLDGAALGNASARSNYSVGSNIKSLGGKVDYSAPI